MKPIHFQTVVEDEQVIRPPDGVSLPKGPIEVTVRVVDPLATTRAWLLQLAREAEQASPALPEDLAEQHDFYAHGKPRNLF